MKQKKIKVQYKDTIMLEYDESGIRIRPLTAEEQAKAEKAELELSIRQKQKELKSMQKRSDADRRRTVIVAESVTRYSDTVPL